MLLPPEAAPLLALSAAALPATGRRTAAVPRTQRHLAPGHSTACRRALTRAEWSRINLGCALTRPVTARPPADAPVRSVGDESVDGHTGRTV